MSLPNYCALPKQFNAPVLSERERYIPDLAEAVIMIESLPVKTMKERRDRAMVAVAFLGALRADTVTSLRVKHIERSNMTIVQDAKTARTKNGKSLRIKFFPLPEVFAKAVCDWKEEMLGLGFTPEDALFPDEKHFVGWRHKEKRARVGAMSSTHAIAQAFRVASKPLEAKVSPHAAKHCIGTLSLEVCKTPEELKAWSMNMGHENEEVTVRYYKHLPTERVGEIFESFDLASESDCSEGEDEKDLMLLYHEHKLNPGTPDFHRARKLVQKRMFQEEEDVVG